jgi:hypothetical protein
VPELWTLDHSNVMKILSFILLVAVFVFVAGCESTTDPLVGWKTVASIGYKSGEMSATVDTLPGYKAITDDVQNFVNKLPIRRREFGPGQIIERRYCYWLGGITLFEDGTGRHAVKIGIDLGYSTQNYVLIYNKSNVRIKTTRFILK